MQFCEDIQKVIKEYTRPYRDPRSHKNHKRVMAQIKRISKAWRAGLRYRVRHPAEFPPGAWVCHRNLLRLLLLLLHAPLLIELAFPLLLQPVLAVAEIRHADLLQLLGALHR